MITEWRYLAYIITKNKNAAEQLAVLASPFPNDPNAEVGTFNSATKLSPQAWALPMIAKKSFVDVLDALMEGAPVDDPRLSYLADRGLTASLWGQAKQIIKAGYHLVVQDDGTRVENYQAYFDFIANNGYTIVPDPAAEL